MRNPRHDVACCWTCRLRRKKCDKARPKCGGCKSLDITCFRGAEKPDWMDGGRKQYRMTQSLKERVRQNVQYRRELSAPSSDMNVALSFVVEPRGPVLQTSQPASSIAPHQHISSEPDLTSNTTINSVSNLSSSESPSTVSLARLDERDSLDSTTAPSSMNTSDSPQNSSRDICTHYDSEDYENTFLTKYLDDVFPFLFPFYRPSIMETGRSWILALVKRSHLALHAVLSLTTYFFTVMLADTYPGEFEPCKREIWLRLGGQTNSYFERIREDVEQLLSQIGVMSTRERVQSMNSILQALIFEIALGRSGNWSIHLTGAFGIFDHIFRHHKSQGEESTFLALLNGIAKPAFYNAESAHYIWTSEHAGFRFFTALLIYVDAIGSTAIERKPCLLDHYPLLLASSDDGFRGREPVLLRLSSHFGCQNWVIIAISEITALAKWKKDAKAKRSLSVMELASGAARIEAKLRGGILDSGSRDHNKPRTAYEKKLQFSQGMVGMLPPVSSATTTQIWAHAALIYLHVVVSGWQPSNTEIRSEVRETLSLLQSIQSPSHLRTFTWPLVVAGCLAEPSEEQQQFRGMVENKSDVEMFGAMTEARDILFKVWDSQDLIDRDTWDIASCLNILGFPALLV